MNSKELDEIYRNNSDMQELILWIDNDQLLYKRYKRINKDTIEDHLFTAPAGIQQISQKLNSQYIAYFQYLKNAQYDYNEKLKGSDMHLKLNNEQLKILAKYLYLREIENKRFEYQTGVDALVTMIDVLNESSTIK